MSGAKNAKKPRLDDIMTEYANTDIFKIVQELNKTSVSRSAQKPCLAENMTNSRSTLCAGAPRITSSEMTASVTRAIEDLTKQSSAKSLRKSNVAPLEKNSKMHTARKELFKIPSNPKAKARISLGRKSVSGRIPVPRSRAQATKPAVTGPAELSPLLNLKEAEEMLIENKLFPFKSPRTPVFKFTSVLSVINESDITKTPESHEKTSPQEFLEMEKLCNVTPPTTKDESPISSVCSMLEKKMLLASARKSSPSNLQMGLSEHLVNMRKVLSKQEMENKRYKIVEEELWENFKKMREENRKKHEQRQLEYMSELTAIVCNLETTNSNIEKENSSAGIKRRSLRLLSKSPLTQKSPNVSPAILKSDDLRKSALTNNLVSKYEKYQLESPRILKAVNLYNSTRQMCSGLATPKTDKKLLAESPKSLGGNWRSTLSRKVQNQCIMLQDTPKHA